MMEAASPVPSALPYVDTSGSTAQRDPPAKIAKTTSPRSLMLSAVPLSSPSGVEKELFPTSPQTPGSATSSVMSVSMLQARLQQAQAKQKAAEAQQEVADIMVELEIAKQGERDEIRSRSSRASPAKYPKSKTPRSKGGGTPALLSSATLEGA